MNLGNLLYWAAQFPPQFCGIMLLILIAVASLIVLLFPKNCFYSEYWAIWLDYRKVLYINACLLFFTSLQAILLPYPLNPFSILQLGLYLLLCGASRKITSNFVSFKSINYVTWLNVVILVISLFPSIRDFTFIETPSGFRFKSFYSEPSYAAFIYIFNMQQLWMRRHQEQISVLLLVNFTCLLFTFSGSGVALLLLLLLIHLSVGMRFNVRIKLLVVLILGLSLLKILAGDAFNQMLIARLQGIANNEIDNSTFLRFIAPWLFLDGLIAKNLHFYLGTGIGGMVEYINYYRSDFGYLVDYSGQYVDAVNNGYVIIVALLGLPLGAITLFWIFKRVWKSKMHLSDRLLFLAYPFFSGWVIHPLFFLLMLLSTSKSKSYHPSVGSRKNI
jgi:hypothetical protein